MTPGSAKRGSEKEGEADEGLSRATDNHYFIGGRVGAVAVGKQQIDTRANSIRRRIRGTDKEIAAIANGKRICASIEGPKEGSNTRTPKSQARGSSVRGVFEINRLDTLHIQRIAEHICQGRKINRERTGTCKGARRHVNLIRLLGSGAVGQ